ncbi:MAG: ATP synthase F1 subunit gamma [Deltaproteobacteria bacterium]|nr:ATP synthase F1 subunit gamma [Deltaproteobacteria bacterium]
MATLRELRKRLKAVKNTQKITKAMKMVSASKLKRAQDAVIQARPYALKMNEVLEHILSHADLAGHPLLVARVPKRVEVLVLSSDRGLCGSFNSNIIRTAERFIDENKGRYEDILVSTIGRKAREHFKRKGRAVYADYEGVTQAPRFERADEIAQDLAARFRAGRVDSTVIVYNEFRSAISQKAVVRELLPLAPIKDWTSERIALISELAPYSHDARAVAGHEGDTALERTAEQSGEGWQPSPRAELFTEGYEHLFEPNRAEVLDALLPQHLAVQVYRAILESTAAEHGARMSAMDSASRNARDMIERLTLRMNRVRQAAITTELMEIISGAEALR